MNLPANDQLSSDLVPRALDDAVDARDAQRSSRRRTYSKSNCGAI
jgi:hypothetical protein